MLKREDNSSVTRFACATFPTREGKAAAPRCVVANQCRSTGVAILASHLSLRTSPQTGVAIPGYLDSLKTPPCRFLTPSRQRRATLPIGGGTCNPSVSLAFDSFLYTREPQYHSTKAVPRPRLPRQCAHCLAMTGEGQCAYCLAMTRVGGSARAGLQ